MSRWQIPVLTAVGLSLLLASCSSTPEPKEAPEDNLQVSPSDFNVVAFGDSVAAGEGIGYGWYYADNYLGWDYPEELFDGRWVTGVFPDQQFCHSTKSYPTSYVPNAAQGGGSEGGAYSYQLGEQLGPEKGDVSVVNLGCTGAGITTGFFKDFTNTLTVGPATTTAQLAHTPDNKGSSVNSQNLNPTLTKFGTDKIDLVTVTMGIDDTGWGVALGACALPGILAGAFTSLAEHPHGVKQAEQVVSVFERLGSMLEVYEEMHNNENLELQASAGGQVQTSQSAFQSIFHDLDFASHAVGDAEKEVKDLVLKPSEQQQLIAEIDRVLNSGSQVSKEVDGVLRQARSEISEGGLSTDTLQDLAAKFSKMRDTTCTAEQPGALGKVSHNIQTKLAKPRAYPELIDAVNANLSNGENRPDILITNYYNPFPPSKVSDTIDVWKGGCADAWLFSKEQRKHFSEVSGNLSNVIEQGVKESKATNVTFVDLGDVMDGHEWCTQERWAYPFSELVFGRDTLKPEAQTLLNQAAFHPTPDGQQKIAEKLKAAYQGR